MHDISCYTHNFTYVLMERPTYARGVTAILMVSNKHVNYLWTIFVVFGMFVIFVNIITEYTILYLYVCIDTVYIYIINVIGGVHTPIPTSWLLCKLIYLSQE